MLRNILDALGLRVGGAPATSDATSVLNVINYACAAVLCQLPDESFERWIDLLRGNRDIKRREIMEEMEKQRH